MKPFCFLPPPKHRSKTLSSNGEGSFCQFSPSLARSVTINLFCEVFLFLYFATHRSKTLSPSCQRRQAATAKDTSASSAFIHARFLIINLFCEASILSVSRHSPLKEFSSSRQRRQAATAPNHPFQRSCKVWWTSLYLCPSLQAFFFCEHMQAR